MPPAKVHTYNQLMTPGAIISGVREFQQMANDNLFKFQQLANAAPVPQEAWDGTVWASIGKLADNPKGAVSYATKLGVSYPPGYEPKPPPEPQESHVFSLENDRVFRE